MYCVKCKQITPSLNEELTYTRNNKRIVKSICAVCQSKKTRFVKNENDIKTFFYI